MKTISVIVCVLTAMMLFGLATSAFAQNDIAAARKQMDANIARQFIRSDLVHGLNANQLLVQSFGDDYFREGFGLSEEQSRKIQEEVLGKDMNPVMQNDPYYKSLLDERNTLDPSHPDATEETLKRFTDLTMEMTDMRIKKKANLIYEYLTPDQMKKVYEFHISNMSDTEFVFPGMFEALDLSDEQRKRLNNIQKEMEPEFEKHIDKVIEYNAKYREKYDAKWNVLTDEEKERLRGDVEFMTKIFADMLPEINAKMKSGKEVTDKLKIKMFDVLTDEQWKRLQELVDHPPDYMKRRITQDRQDMERIRKAGENTASSAGGWQPGPGSWQPGDAIPEVYRQERNSRRPFPVSD